MKKVILLALVLTVGATSGTFAQKKKTEAVYFKSSMDCAQCEITLNEYLKFEKGVKDLKVDHASNTIYIEYAGKKNSEAGLAQAIEKKGYKAEKISEKEYSEIVAHAKEQGHEHGAEVHRERD